MNPPFRPTLSRIIAAILLGSAFGPAVGFAIDGNPTPSQISASGPVSVTIRGNLDHSRAKFARGDAGRVAFMGGSITEMEGYRPMVMESLKTRFPDTEFEFLNAGVSSTCSHTGAFRLPADVLAQKPDLLFVEFAVNDDQDAAHRYENAVRGMEGIVRSARTQLPNLDIVITHFVNPEMLQTIQEGKVPVSIAAHEAVAQHYGISTCNVAVALADQIAKGKTTWAIYGGVHPKPAGNRIAADLIESVFQQTKFSSADYSSAESSNAPQPAADQTLSPHALPVAIDPTSFSRGRFLDAEAVQLSEGWARIQPSWKDIPGTFRDRFGGRILTVATAPGSQLEVSFSGTAVGIYVLAGPDAGSVEFSIDDGDWHTVDLYHRFSKGLHYPRTVVLRSDLIDAQHHMKLRVANKKNPSSNGNAVRILEFVAS